MKKIALYVLMMIGLLSSMMVMTPTPVSAASCDDGSSFFGLRPWYYKLTEGKNGKCEIQAPKDNELDKFVWSIVLNILTDISVMIGYVAVIMIAWGGYLYMFSRGLPDRAEKGKKTLISAIIGLLISVLASVIMNTIVSVLTGTS